MKYRFLFSVFCCLAILVAQGQITVSGYLSDAETGENLLFANAGVEGRTSAVTSNEYGYYALTFDPDSAQAVIVYSYIGYESVRKTISTQANVVLNVSLPPKNIAIGTAEIEADANKEEENLRSTTMSTVRLPIKNLTDIPTLGGESDILKVVQLLPGVQGGTEGGTDMFVRGGEADQNLVLLDEATVYNTGHLFGFFSVFNSDALADVTLIKGAFPGKYGGRLSSILDIRMKEGNRNEFHGRGGIGLLSSRITLEGPIKKDKASFLISGRRTYIDRVVKALGQTLPYYFYDLNAKLNWEINANNRLFFTNYLGDDVLEFDQSDFDDPGQEDDSPFGFGFRLGNITNSLRWNHVYNSKTFSNISLIHTQFDYDISGEVVNNSIFIGSKVRDLGVKADFDYFAKEGRKIQYGGQVLHHRFRPNVVSTAGDIGQFLDDREGDLLLATEFGLYGSWKADLKEGLWRVNVGMRLTGATVENKTYGGLEPRLAVRRMLSEKDVLKASYSRMRQYIHRVSSSSVSLPTDLWYPATERVEPQVADQVAIGYQHLFSKWKTTFELEGYYKWMDHVIEYREGANLILNDNFEDELIQGEGAAYGIEALLKRDEGKLSGWLAYTLSWATRDFEELNRGERFFARYDRRHNVSAVLNWKISQRCTLSAVWVYASGARFTPQVGQYLIPNPSLTGYDLVPIYAERNSVELSPSHRLDVNFVLGPRPDKKSRFRSEWHFGVYNLYNRAAPFRVDIVANTDANGNVGYQYQQPGLFGLIPSIAYNFEF